MADREPSGSLNLESVICYNELNDPGISDKRSPNGENIRMSSSEFRGE
jgi:hypothetical protein